MKKISQIMEEMGFRKDAPDSIKESFIKHLIHINSVDKLQIEQSDLHQIKTKKNLLNEPEQLDFFIEAKKKIV